MGINLTNGWDTVVATRLTNLNIGLRKAYDAGLLTSELNKSFTYSFLGFFVLKCEIKTQVGPWKIQGGSGEIISLQIPLTKGVFSIKNEDKVKSVDIEDWVFKINLFLTKIDNVITDPEKGKISDLVIKFTGNALESVLIDTPNLPEGLDDIKVILNTKFADLFTDTCYKIASVNLDFLQENYPYIVPKTFKYAIEEYILDSGKNNSSFGILMQTVSKSQGSPSLQRGVIPNKGVYCNSAAICSNEILLKYIIKPGLIKAFKLKEGLDSFDIVETSITNAYKIINNIDIKAKISDYDINISLLEATVDDGLVVNVKGQTRTAIFSIDFTAKFHMSTALNQKKQTISFIVDKESSYFNSDVHIVWWLLLIEAVMFALILVYTGTVAGLVFAITISLTNLIITTLVNNTIKKVVTSSLPIVIPNCVTWNYQKYFTLSQLNLPSPLQIGGVIPFLQEPKDDNNVKTEIIKEIKVKKNDSKDSHELHNDKVVISLRREELNSISSVDQEKSTELENAKLNLSLHKIGSIEENLNLSQNQKVKINKILKPIEDQVFKTMFSSRENTLEFLNNPLGSLHKNGININQEELLDLLQEIKSTIPMT
ncbi:hypothetical protein DMA11_17520 [Marinilabiliaceae bacterium JC017]|nr:hypothetical protein DMA11_17520 [Marinilabiliaceae bacterium JC017]